MYHRPKVYEGGAQIDYVDKDKTYKVLLTFSERDGVTGHAQGERTDTLAEGLDSALPCHAVCSRIRIRENWHVEEFSQRSGILPGWIQSRLTDSQENGIYRADV